MVLELVKMINERFPPFRGAESIAIYGAHERLHVSGIDDQLYDTIRRGKPEPLEDHAVIKEIAKRVFDAPFVYETRGTVKDSLFFTGERDEHLAYDDPHNRYLNNWSNQHITVELPKIYPMMTFDLANRGNGELFPKQRQKYVEFMLAIYALFYERAKNGRT